MVEQAVPSAFIISIYIKGKMSARDSLLLISLIKVFLITSNIAVGTPRSTYEYGSSGSY
jgi:hypothetical protein